MYQVLAFANTQGYHYIILTSPFISETSHKEAWNIFWQNQQYNGTETEEYPVIDTKCQAAQAKIDVDKIEGIYIRCPSLTAVTL